MKTVCLTTAIVVFLLLFTNRIQAQTTDTKLDQMELMQQALGIWKGEIAKDTVMIMNFTSYGRALEDSITIITKGNTISSSKEIWGYNQKYDKIVVACIGEKSPQIRIYAGWFSSQDTMNLVSYQYLSDPEKSTFKIQWILIPPDSAKRIVYQNNMVTSIITYFREKL